MTASFPYIHSNSDIHIQSKNMDDLHSSSNKTGMQTGNQKAFILQKLLNTYYTHDTKKTQIFIKTHVTKVRR
jgi:hypothetical protein